MTSLEKAILEKEKFLTKYPQMKDFQNEIDQELDKAGDNMENRMLILKKLMQDNLNELNKQKQILTFLIED